MAKKAGDSFVTVERLLSAQLPVNLLRYTQDQGRAFYRNVVERVESLPGYDRTVPPHWREGALRG